MAKQPAFQFYPGDWLKDPELRICSHFARGLLVDLLCTMFEAKFRGRLVCADGTTPWTDQQIVDTSSGGERQAKLEALDELLRHGVLKRDAQGVVFSARMIRDEEIRQERSKAGSKGGSKSQAKGQANHQAKGQAKTGSSSSSSSESESESETEQVQSNGHNPTQRHAATEQRIWSPESVADLASTEIQPTGRGASIRELAKLDLESVTDWWTRHIGRRPLTGSTALDWLLVLCWAANCRTAPKAIQNKLGAFGAGLKSGEWLRHDTDAKLHTAEIRRLVNQGTIAARRIEATP